MIPISHTLAYSLAPVGLAGLVAVIATFKVTSGFVRSCIQHFAAGVVFAVAAGELLPDIVSRHLPLEVGIGFALGVAAMLLLRSFTRRLEERSGSKHRFGSLLVPVAIDIAIDGLLLGIGFAAGARQGRLLTFAFAAEFVSLGLAVTATLRNAGESRGQSLALVTAVLAGFPIMSVLGETVLRGISRDMMEIVLAFGLAALLYLVTEELLVEAHEEPETPVTTAAFFAGFLIFLLVGMPT
jgi:ZIP family zinc transporter